MALLILWGALITMNELFGGIGALTRSRAMLIVHGVMASIGAAGAYLHFASQAPVEEAKFYYIGAGVTLIMVIVKILAITLACIQGCGIGKDEVKHELIKHEFITPTKA